MTLFSSKFLIARISFPQIKGRDYEGGQSEEDRFSDAGLDVRYVTEVDNYAGLQFTIEPDSDKSGVALKRIAKARRQLERLYRKHLKRNQVRRK